MHVSALFMNYIMHLFYFKLGSISFDLVYKYGISQRLVFVLDLQLNSSYDVSKYNLVLHLKGCDLILDILLYMMITT